jgi:hypothetical protein
MSEPVNLCADNQEPRTLVIVDSGEYWIPLFALDMVYMILYPEVSPLAYDIAVMFARKRLDWLKSSRDQIRRSVTLSEELQQKERS